MEELACIVPLTLWPTALVVCVLLCRRDDFLLRRFIGLAALLRACAVLGLGFNLGLGKLGFVEQVVDFPIQQRQLGLDVFGQQDWTLFWWAFLLLRYCFILPRLEETENVGWWDRCGFLLAFSSFIRDILETPRKFSIINHNCLKWTLWSFSYI